MALPDNGHHVHDVGYYAEMEQPDAERMLEEIRSEIDIEIAVTDAVIDSDLNGPYLHIEHEASQRAAVERVVDDWDVRVVDAGDGWAEIRP